MLIDIKINTTLEPHEVVENVNKNILLGELRLYADRKGGILTTKGIWRIKEQLSSTEQAQQSYL